MDKAKIFTNGRSQAVRLPKEYRFKEREVFIHRIDDAVVIYPKKNPWKLLEKSLDKFTDDFMEKRDQPAVEDKREFE